MLNVLNWDLESNQYEHCVNVKSKIRSFRAVGLF